MGFGILNTIFLFAVFIKIHSCAAFNIARIAPGIKTQITAKAVNSYNFANFKKLLFHKIKPLIIS